MHHSVLVRQHVLGATKDEDLGIRALGAKDAGIKRKLHLDGVNAVVVRATRGVLALRILRIRPHVDELVLVTGRLVELIRLNEAEIRTRTGLDTGRIAEADGGLAHGIEDQTGGLVERTREVKVVGIRPVLGTNNPHVLINAVVKLETGVVLDTGSRLNSARRGVVGLGGNDLEIVKHLGKGNLAELVALLIVKVDIGALHAALEVTLLERRQGQGSRGKTGINLLVRKAVGANIDLAPRRVDEGLSSGAEVNLQNDLVKGQSNDWESQAAVAAEAEGQRNPERMRALGPGRLLLNGVKLADKLVRELGRATSQCVPHVHERVGERINDSPADSKRHVLEQTIPDGVVPVRRNGANLVVLDADETRKIDAGIRVPGQITLTRHHVLGRPTEAGLGRSRIVVHGLKRVCQMLLMDEAPKANSRLLKGLRNQNLVGVALGGKFSPNGIVSGAHLFDKIQRSKGNERI